MICLKNRTFAVSQTAITARAGIAHGLWFAWKIVLLQYHKQHAQKELDLAKRCDLLEKSYFCSITNSKAFVSYFNEKVVICLKNRTFAVSQTAIQHLTNMRFMLWFAWKIVLLQYHKQLNWKKMYWHSRCDLLEKSYFCSITNSPRCREERQWAVVICLKNRTFAVSQTAVIQNLLYRLWLWFAWKIVLLQYHKQHAQKELDLAKRCDLLEKSYFCSITNSCLCCKSCLVTVVICLKNRTFAVSQTAQHQTTTTNVQLWFAWKIVLLQYHKQRLGLI